MFRAHGGVDRTREQAAKEEHVALMQWWTKSAAEQPWRAQNASRHSLAEVRQLGKLITDRCSPPAKYGTYILAGRVWGRLSMLTLQILLLFNLQQVHGCEAVQEGAGKQHMAGPAHVWFCRCVC